MQFTIGKEAERKLRRLQELLKREIPDGDPAVIFDRALTVLLEHCQTHNAYEGRRIFGPYLPREIREARAADEASLTAVPERRRGAPMQ